MKKNIIKFSKGLNYVITCLLFFLVPVICFADIIVKQNSFHKKNEKKEDITKERVCYKRNVTFIIDSLKTNYKIDSINSTMYGPPKVGPKNYYYTNPQVPGKINGYQDLKKIPTPPFE